LEGKFCRQHHCSAEDTITDLCTVHDRHRTRISHTLPLCSVTAPLRTQGRVAMLVHFRIRNRASPFIQQVYLDSDFDAVDRIYVHDEIYDAFMAKFLPLVEALIASMGDVTNDNTKVGAITRPQHMQYLQQQVRHYRPHAHVVCHTGSSLRLTKCLARHSRWMTQWPRAARCC